MSTLDCDDSDEAVWSWMDLDDLGHQSLTWIGAVVFHEDDVSNLDVALLVSPLVEALQTTQVLCGPPLPEMLD